MKTLSSSTFAVLVTLLNPPQLVLAQASDLETLADSIAAEHVGSTLAGLSIGVSRGDEVLLKKSYGHANLQWQVPMPMDSIDP